MQVVAGIVLPWVHNLGKASDELFHRAAPALDCTQRFQPCPLRRNACVQAPAPYAIALAWTLLTFLAGAELDPDVFRAKWKEAGAIVYAVMLEFGFNATDYGKAVLAACFVTDLGTVLALGLIFAPFTYRTLVLLLVCVAILIFLPWITAQFFRLYGGRPSELETKYLLFLLFGLGALATWADS